VFVEVLTPRLSETAPGLPSLAAGDTGCWVPGRLLHWRWVDKNAAQWSGLVRFTRENGLTYEQWFPGAQIRRHSPDGERGQGAVSEPEILRH